MSKSFHFELNRAGVRELLLSGEMEGVISEHAERIRSAAEGMTGLEYASSTKKGANRVTGTVEADSAHAYYENLKNNTLIKALGGG